MNTATLAELRERDDTAHIDVRIDGKWNTLDDLAGEPGTLIVEWSPAWCELCDEPLAEHGEPCREDSPHILEMLADQEEHERTMSSLGPWS